MVAIPRPAPIPVPRWPRPRLNWWGVATAILATAALALPVFQASTTTETGFEAERLRDERLRLETELRDIEGDIAGLMSITRIEERARALGFSPAIAPIHVTVEEPGPPAHRLPHEYLAGQP